MFQGLVSNICPLQCKMILAVNERISGRHFETSPKFSELAHTMLLCSSACRFRFNMSLLVTLWKMFHQNYQNITGSWKGLLKKILAATDSQWYVVGKSTTTCHDNMEVSYRSIHVHYPGSRENRCNNRSHKYSGSALTSDMAYPCTRCCLK